MIEETKESQKVKYYQWDEEMTEYANQILLQENNQMTQEMYSKLEKDAKRNWDIFYKNNKTNFYKDRHYIKFEFSELSDRIKTISEDDKETKYRLLDVGCGVGNGFYPLYREFQGKLLINCCDFSIRAVNFVKDHELYKADEVNAHVVDLVNDEFPFEKESADFGLMLFVMSAISPENFKKTAQKIYDQMKDDGILYFRDYGRYDLAQLRLAQRVGQKKNQILGQGHLASNDTLGNHNYETMGKIQDPSHKTVTVQPVTQTKSQEKTKHDASNNQNVETQQALILGDTQRVKFGFNELDTSQKPLTNNEAQLKMKQSRNDAQNDNTKFETNEKSNSPPAKQNQSLNLQGASQDRLEGKQTNTNDDLPTFNDELSKKEHTKSLVHPADDEKVFKLPEIHQKSHRTGGIEELIQPPVEQSNRKSLEEEYQQKQMSKMEIKKEAQRIKDAVGTQRSTLSNQNVELNQKMATNYVNDLFSMFTAPPAYNASIGSAPQTQIVNDQESPQRNSVLNQEQAQSVIDYQQASSYNDSEQRGSHDHQRSSGIVPRAIFQDHEIINEHPGQNLQQSTNDNQHSLKNDISQSVLSKQDDSPTEELKLQDKIKVETDEPEAEDKIGSQIRPQESIISRSDSSSNKQQKSDTQSSSYKNPGYTQSSVETNEIDYDLAVARTYVQKLMSTQVNNHQQFRLPPQSSQSNRNGTEKAAQEQTPFLDNPIKLETSHIRDDEEIDNRSDSEIQREIVNDYLSELRKSVLTKSILTNSNNNNQ